MLDEVAEYKSGTCKEIIMIGKVRLFIEKMVTELRQKSGGG